MPNKFQFFKWSNKKAVAFFVLIIAVTILVIGSTIAYVIAKTNSLENRFTPPNLDVDIGQSNTIVNSGDIPVYVRVALVSNWVNTTDGSTLSTAPNVVYVFADPDQWAQGSDGFYYYKKPLAAGASIMTLASATTGDTIPDGCKLQVQVLSSAIQSTPAEAVAEAWGVTVNADGTLTVN
ncbi:MAG: hypothetical protein IKC26_00680 [Clostridia bacterium]|nr:hypothetical protein [Clostridia bacterium]